MKNIKEIKGDYTTTYDETPTGTNLVPNKAFILYIEYQNVKQNGEDYRKKLYQENEIIDKLTEELTLKLKEKLGIEVAFLNKSYTLSEY